MTHLGEIRRVLFTQLTAHFILDCSGGSKFRPLVHIIVKSSLYLTETAPKSSQTHPYFVVVGPLWANMPPISKTASLWTDVDEKWSRHILLITLWYLLSRATSLYGSLERICALLCLKSKICIKFKQSDFYRCHHLFWITIGVCSRSEKVMVSNLDTYTFVVDAIQLWRVVFPFLFKKLLS